MLRAEAAGAAIYQPGSYLFTRITELKDDLAHRRVAGLTPLFHAQNGLGFPRSGRLFHCLLKGIISAPSARVEGRPYQWRIQ